MTPTGRLATVIAAWLAIIAILGALAPKAEHKPLPPAPGGSYPIWSRAVCQGPYNDYGPQTALIELSDVSHAAGGHVYEVRCANGFSQIIAR